MVPNWTMPWAPTELRRQRAQQRPEGMERVCSEVVDEVELFVLVVEAMEVELPVAWRGWARGRVGSCPWATAVCSWSSFEGSMFSAGPWDRCSAGREASNGFQQSASISSE